MTSSEERPVWLPDDLFPFESRFVTISGTRVHYIDEGQGPTLLLLHGNPTYSFLYRHLVLRLRPLFRCVAPDFLGFGLSKAPVGFDFRPASHAKMLKAFIEALDLKGVVVMVQDWSGPIGLSVAANDAARFRGIVIGNTFAWSGRGDPHYERFSAFMGGPVARLLNRLFNFFPRVLLARGICRKRLSAREMAAYLGPFTRHDSRLPMSILAREIIGSTLFLETLQSSLGSLSELPALIVWGDRDFAFGEKERLRFETIFKNSTTILLPVAGHFIQEDAPEEIADAIVARFSSRSISPQPRPTDERRNQ